MSKIIYYLFILFIYYQFLSKTGVTQKAKPVQGASPQNYIQHTHYTYTQDQTNKLLQKRNIHTNKNLSYSELKNKKMF